MENEWIYREDEELNHQDYRRPRVVTLPETSGGFALFHFTPTWIVQNSAHWRHCWCIVANTIKLRVVSLLHSVEQLWPRASHRVTGHGATRLSCPTPATTTTTSSNLCSFLNRVVSAWLVCAVLTLFLFNLLWFYPVDALWDAALRSVVTSGKLGKHPSMTTGKGGGWRPSSWRSSSSLSASRCPRMQPRRWPTRTS
uniref:Uncharacterized protein n=1 Tax=Oryza glaberrima TaxID=4538 RepID=I1NX96_ORYGL